LTFEPGRGFTVIDMATEEALSTRYRIAEIAELSDFTPSALRYYEQACGALLHRSTTRPR
jgi:hypothetical protein